MTRVVEQIPAMRRPRSAGAPVQVLPAARAPRWRSLLEDRWQARLQEVTELSLAYHDAAAAPALRAGGDEARPAKQQLRRLLRQAVSARRALADTEDALTRLANGRYGRCEHCATALPPGVLAVEPETRYCERCLPESAGRTPRRGGQVLNVRPVRC
jgi:RNA polymerase-binding transcription factor DksA